jgi:hypothetical protein
MPGWVDVPLRVLSPLDVRARILNGSEHFALCVTGAVVEDQSGTHDFWAKARYFADRLKPVKSIEYMSTRIEMLHRDVSQISTVQQAQEFFAQRFSSEILLTNLGVAEFRDTYGPLTPGALWGPAVLSSFANAQTVGAVTVRDQLHLLHASSGPAIGLLGEVSSLLSAALDELPGRASQADVHRAPFDFPRPVS